MKQVPIRSGQMTETHYQAIRIKLDEHLAAENKRLKESIKILSLLPPPIPGPILPSTIEAFKQAVGGW